MIKFTIRIQIVTVLLLQY